MLNFIKLNMKMMKKISILLTVVALLFCFSTDSFAQLGKKEKKEWKKKAKTYSKNPAALKQLEDDNAAQKTQLGSLESKVSSLESTVSDKDATISDLQANVQKLRSDLAGARKQVADMQAAQAEEPAANAAKGKTISMKGVVFKVQIGAFRNKDLSKYFDNNDNFSGEKDEDGTQKITLGYFSDYWEADTFKKYLREMGVKDAWIVPYRDGVRVDIKDVLEGVQGGK